MSTPNLVLYGMKRLGPFLIGQHAEFVRTSGFTSIVLGMLHIGNPAVKSTTRLGDIIFNGDEPLVISDGEPPFPLVTGQQKADCLAWPDQIKGLKNPASSFVTKVFASVGGGGADADGKPLVRDFESIKAIYDANGKTFANSVLERNFRLFRKVFPAIDGIDMDCEETYDPDSFVAFCRMLIEIGFEITFCPYWNQKFWVDALYALRELHLLRYVKWVNLQCYDGGGSNQPDQWAAAIGDRFGMPPFKDFVVPGLAARFWNNGAWAGDCPGMITQRFSAYPRDLLAGGFLWEMDAIIDAERRKDPPAPCPNDPSPITLAGYAGALKKGLGS